MEPTGSFTGETWLKALQRKGNVQRRAQFLFDNWNNLPLCGGSERVPTLSEDLDEILCGVTASRAKDGVMQSVTFVDGHTIIRVYSDNVRDSLGRQEHGGQVERLKPDLRRTLSVCLGVERNFREQNGMFFRAQPLVRCRTCDARFSPCRSNS